MEELAKEVKAYQALDNSVWILKRDAEINSIYCLRGELKDCLTKGRPYEEYEIDLAKLQIVLNKMASYGITLQDIINLKP